MINTSIRSDEKGSPYTVYLLAVCLGEEEQWRFEKRFSAFSKLEALLRKERPDVWPSASKLPEKVLFRRLSPAVVDERKGALQSFLNSLLKICPEWPALQAFLSSDIKGFTTEKLSETLTGHKSGYLSKRGRTLGVWIPRFFVYHGGSLTYYKNNEVRGSERQPPQRYSANTRRMRSRWAQFC